MVESMWATSLANKSFWYVSVTCTWSSGDSCSFSTGLAANADLGASNEPESGMTKMGMSLRTRRVITLPVHGL